MKFAFTVGTSEPHQVAFSFDQFIGKLEIKVDGETVVNDFRAFSLRLVERYDLWVGVQEKHRVAIEKERRRFMAGWRPQKYRVFIDGELVQTYEG